MDGVALFSPHLTFSSYHIVCFQDDNRYTAGRGAHLTLKRAEKARVSVNKISGKDLFD